MRKLPMVAMVSAVLLAGCGEKEVVLESNIDKMSYGIGMSMARSVTGQPIDINKDALVAGLQDALNEKEARLTEEVIREAFTTVREEQQAKQQEEAQAAVQLGSEYLVETAKKEGVKSTESGLLYEVIQAGEGDSPAETDVVEVHYQGTLIDGSVFDSSIERGTPAKFPVNRVISGWTEALQLMKVGGKWRLHIPAALAYGEQSPSPKIPANSTLVFEVELLAIEKS
ncbi:FKBP-type peptidyl-prolyl cis-trans isomerase [Oceaniserpentilla sp. 4NH20-0058]|uniref:FKBP-type peptidyl-prolyl cis-trans isomerase n=1 Tax=Oceaniserpentilla sp. 4NH20-0058 TaxID=3127660 RepID=UPI00310823E0